MIKSEKLSGIFDLVSIFASATVIVAIAFLVCFRTIAVSGESMCDTLQDKDRLIISAISEPKPGDIVVTCQPSYYAYIESTLVKRVIATEGQKVDIDFEKGIVYVDGVALDEPYTKTPTNREEGTAFPIVVPKGEVFVMGDNRNGSSDSRDIRIGTIRTEYILGKALFRIMPFGNFKIG